MMTACDDVDELLLPLTVVPLLCLMARFFWLVAYVGIFDVVVWWWWIGSFHSFEGDFVSVLREGDHSRKCMSFDGVLPPLAEATATGISAFQRRATTPPGDDPLPGGGVP